jgi:glycosyltransferase involved in cell wall biosynthesis/peptidoglycan/xylan/chitin deacetylase (PgdA/CDA1 family)
MSQSETAGGSDILFIVNSVFGGRNTPGFRPFQPIRFGRIHPTVIARGTAVAYAPMRFPLPGRSVIPRGLNFLRIKLWPSLPSRAIEQGLFDRLCLRACRRLGWRPRAVHLWDQLPETAAFWHAQGVPVVVDLQMAHPRCYQPLVAAGALDPTPLGSLDDPALDRCVELADRLVCPSHFVLDSLPPGARAKAVVIPFGADPVTAAPSSTLPEGDGDGAGDGERPLRVLFAGNVNLRKGVPFLLDAWGRLPPDIAARAELVLCGRLFREMAESLAAAPANVRAVGFQGDMAPWFAGADVFALPSLMEGSAKAVYEAMAHGLASVVSAHAGSVIDHGVDGLVVPPADAAALAAALAQVLGDAGLRRRMGEAARATATRHTWDAYATAIADVHRDWPDPAARPAASPARLADTWREHQAPRALPWRINGAVQRAGVGVKSIGRRIGGTPGSTWLRFPFYHHVFADERRGFAAHLDAMRAEGEFIGLDDAVDLLAGGQPVDGRYFCLTFDDGFRNVMTHGAPLLAARGIPAAMFVVSGLTADGVGRETGDRAGFFGRERRPAAFLSWQDCRDLVGAGFTIGSHTVGHRRLVTLGDDEAEAELAGSKADIEAALGVACHHFCCPWGKPGRDFRLDRDPDLAARLGYRSFLTTKWGAMGGGDPHSPFAIRRVGLVARYGLAQLRHFLSL